MKVSIHDIKQIFESLIKEDNSREEIALWALKRQFESEEGNLELPFSNEEKKIWRSITYLMGVDLKDMDGSYLHSTENFIEFREKLGI